MTAVSARALEVLDDIAERWGEDLGDGLARVRRSQAALASDLGCSAGTLAYYLSHAGPAVRRGRNEIVIDRTVTGQASTSPGCGRPAQILAALAERWGRRRPDGQVELVGDQGLPPTTRAMGASLGLHHSTVERHLERLEAGRQLSRRGRRIILHLPDDSDRPVSEQDTPDRPADDPNRGTDIDADPADPDGLDELAVIAQLSQTLALLADAAHNLIDLASSYRQSPRPVGRQTADSRDLAADIAIREQAETSRQLVDGSDSQAVATKNLATSYCPISATTADTSRLADPLADPAEQPRFGQSSSQDLDVALAPLLNACRTQGKPISLDDYGRRALSQHSPTALAAGVQETLRLMGIGKLKTPVGFLVDRALRSPEFFDQALTPTTDQLSTPRRDTEHLAVIPSQTDLAVCDEAFSAVDELTADPSRRSELAALDDRVRARGTLGRLSHRRMPAAMLRSARALAWQEMTISAPAHRPAIDAHAPDMPTSNDGDPRPGTGRNQPRRRTNHG